MTGERCAERIHVSASGAKLSDVLKTMADRLGFTLRFAARRDPVVDFSREADAETILRELTAGQNLLAVHRPDEQCGRNVISEVELLASGDAVARFEYIPHANETSRAAPLPREQRQPLPEGSRRRLSDAEWQKMKDDLATGRATYDPETGEINTANQQEDK